MSDPSPLHAHQAALLSAFDQMPEQMPVREHRLQVESWRDGPVDLLLVAVQGPEAVLAWLVRHDAVRNEWTGGCAGLAPSESHHDRTAVVAGVPLLPLTAGDMGRLGIIGGNGDLAEVVLAALAPEQRPPLGVLALATGMGKTAMMAQMAGRIRRAPSRYASPEAFGYPSEASGRLTTSLQGPRIQAPGNGTRPPGVVTVPHRADAATLPEDLASRVLDLVRSGTATLSGRHHAEAGAILGDRNWTAGGHAFYASPGRTGERRRQAGRLYPALAPALAASPEVAGLVDAGRPYEDALGRSLATIRNAAPTVAALRRLRCLPADTGFDHVVGALDAALRLPVDWLPEDPEAWRLLVKAIDPLIHPAASLGLRLADVVAHARGAWHGFLPSMGRPHANPAPSGASMEGAKEMARRFRDTVIRQIRRSQGQEPSDTEDLRIAGALLFGGKSLPGIHGLQRRWHAGLAALEARLPASQDGQSWPPAFPPFEAGDGIVIACLTTEAALKDEGRDGLDGDGVAGLDHCVGGFGRSCYTGTAFVASIRRVTPSGFERLSTVEFEAVPGSGSRLRLVQHYGRGNRHPPVAALEALHGLVEAVEAGTHRVEAEALVERDGDGYRDTYDWRMPGALEQAIRAWSPFLPRDIARGGVNHLRKRIEGIVPTLGPPMPELSGTPQVMIIDAAGAGELLADRAEARAARIRAERDATPRPGP